MSGDPRTPPERRLADVVAFPSVSRGGGDRGRAAPVIVLEAYRDSRAHRVHSSHGGTDTHHHAPRACVIDLAAYRAARGSPGLDPAA